VVEKSGAWMSYEGQRIGQGRENAKAYLKENPAIAARIEKAIRQNSGLVAEALLAEPESDADGVEVDEDGVVIETPTASDASPAEPAQKAGRGRR